MSNVLLPNLQKIGTSNSTFLSTLDFSKYLDFIINSVSLDNICSNNSYYIEDYFLEINFSNLMYTIPNKLIDNILKCQKNINIKYFIIPIALIFEFNKPGHSNIIIIDNENKTIEFFEPHGISFKQSLYDTETHIKNVLEIIFPKQTKEYNFINAHNDCPIGIQSKQNMITQDGHCLAWSLLFAHIRMLNLHLITEEISEYFLKHFNSYELDLYIRRYINFIEHSNRFITHKYTQTLKYTITNFSDQEIISIKSELIKLIREYKDMTHKDDKTEIFNKIVSFSKFDFFYNIFFITMNYNKNINNKRQRIN